MPAKQKDRDDPVNTLDTLGFQVFVTLAMRAILMRDSILTWHRPSKSTPPTTGSQLPRIVTSGSRRLDARLALPCATPSASVLILHGIGERLEYWSDAQQLLAAHGIASLIIGYSGYGASEGAVTPANLRQDVLASYAELQRFNPTLRPPFVLGLSLGTGVAVDAAPYLQPSPSGVILCEAFSSLRDAATTVCRSLPLLRYLSPWLTKLIPDLYRTASSASAIAAPLLIVHSDEDELFPTGMARQIFAAAHRGPACKAELAILSGYAHNDAYLHPSSGYWKPILEFIKRQSSK